MSENKKQLAVYNLMRLEDGRKWVWDRLQYCGVNHSTFDPDPIGHAYSAGMRDAGLELERCIKANEPILYMKMIEENNE